MRILFVGAVNKGKSPKGGEEYKNQILVQKLCSLYSCKVIDTFNWKRKPLQLIQLMGLFIFSRFDAIVISASSRSVYQLLRVISKFSSNIHKAHYFVIGGFFPKAIKEGIYKKEPYGNLKSIVVEGDEMKDSLIASGIETQIHLVPNFKEFEIISGEQLREQGSVKFVFVGRISEPKGLELIFQAVENLKSIGFSKAFEVHCYGPLEDAYAERFNSQLNEQVQYRGYLDLMGDSKGSYAKLAEYHCMLFPTFWQGEGFPGVIIDAFIAGLPVIATDWNMNRELIQNGVNGFLLPEITAEALANCMEDILGNPDQLQQLSINARNEAGKYHIDKVWPQIQAIIEA